jgi:hypothetical protein
MIQTADRYRRRAEAAYQPSLLRCQRDQAPLLDTAAQADPEHCAWLERRADQSPRGPL